MRDNRPSVIVRTVIHETEGPIKLVVERETLFVNDAIEHRVYNIWFRKKENTCNSVVLHLASEQLALDLCARAHKKLVHMKAVEDLD